MGGQAGGRLPGPFLPFANADAERHLREIAHALDTLNADGMSTCSPATATGGWTRLLAPVLDELNRRKAVVYTHPATADRCRNLLPEIPATVIEFGIYMSRTITDIIFSGRSIGAYDAQFIFRTPAERYRSLRERLVRLPVQNPAMQKCALRGAERIDALY